jgi:hypothetical protein
MTPDDPTPDTLTRDYQRAAAAQADRPGDATRTAILAEARAATLRRRPAANDSRYVWRAVAGVAVVGVALLLWRQSAPVMTPVMTTVQDQAPRETDVRAAPASEAKPAEPAAVANVPVQAVARTERQRAAPADELRSSKALEKSSGAISGAGANSDAAAVMVAPAAPAESAFATRSAAAAARQDVRPAEAPGEWVLLDRDGTPLQRGAITGADTLDSIRADLVKRFPGRTISAWQVKSQTAAARLE